MQRNPSERSYAISVFEWKRGYLSQVLRVPGTRYLLLRTVLCKVPASPLARVLPRVQQW